MKNFFVQLFYAVAAGVAAGTGGAIVEPTSPKLEELKAQAKAAWAEMIKHEDPDSQAALDANLAVVKIKGEIKAEKARLVAEANEAKIAELRNERLKLISNYKAAVQANTGKGANQTTADAETAAYELLSNELMAKFAASSVGKKAATANGTEQTGTKAAAKAAILELARAGKSHKEIEAAGFARSTVWHTINNAKLAGEVFAQG